MLIVPFLLGLVVYMYYQSKNPWADSVQLEVPEKHPLSIKTTETTSEYVDRAGKLLLSMHFLNMATNEAVISNDPELLERHKAMGQQVQDLNWNHRPEVLSVLSPERYGKVVLAYQHVYDLLMDLRIDLENKKEELAINSMFEEK